MSRIASVSVNLGVFLIILGALILTSLVRVSPLTPLESLSLVIATFGIWLALVSVIMPTPSVSYAATRPMFLGWGGILTGLGLLWFAAIYGLVAIAFAVLLIAAGIGALGYSLTRPQAKKPQAPVP